MPTGYIIIKFSLWRIRSKYFSNIFLLAIKPLDLQNVQNCQCAEAQDFPMMLLTNYSCPTQDGSTFLSSPPWVSVFSMWSLDPAVSALLDFSALLRNKCHSAWSLFIHLVLVDDNILVQVRRLLFVRKCFQWFMPTSFWEAGMSITKHCMFWSKPNHFSEHTDSVKSGS